MPGGYDVQRSALRFVSIEGGRGLGVGGPFLHYSDPAPMSLTFFPLLSVFLRLVSISRSQSALYRRALRRLSHCEVVLS